MKKVKLLLSAVLLVAGAQIYGQNLNENWNEELRQAVADFKNCTNPEGTTANPCSKFFAESLFMVYELKDFYPEEGKRYPTGTEIASMVQSDAAWTEIGPAYVQENLSKAQELANKNEAVLAIFIGEDKLGHVSMILPGKLQASGSWGMSVPNSVSFFIHSPSKSYANKPLSYAFARNMIKNVVLYSRVY
jgi:hypothetical protein